VRGRTGGGGGGRGGRGGGGGGGRATARRAGVAPGALRTAATRYPRGRAGPLRGGHRRLLRLPALGARVGTRRRLPPAHMSSIELERHAVAQRAIDHGRAPCAARARLDFSARQG